VVAVRQAVCHSRFLSLHRRFLRKPPTQFTLRVADSFPKGHYLVDWFLSPGWRGQETHQQCRRL